jgi:DNA-binding transcriptional MocR family regulator
LKKPYQKIADAMKKAIQEGRYKRGEKLPSTRALCALHHVSAGTAVKAYDALKNEHLIYAIPRSGWHILENRFQPLQPDPEIIDFSRGNPLLDKFLMPDIKHCLDQAIDMCTINSAEWHELYGVPSLRKLLPQYLADFKIFALPENILVNLGVQHALGVLNNMPFPNQREVILIEQPTYRYYNRFLQSNFAKTLGIPRTADGIDVDLLESMFKKGKIKFFYTIPNSHNPLGTCYSTAQRKMIAQLAEKYDVYIVEDDYFGDIQLGGHGDPIYSYGDHQHHIYLKSFIKIIPWIRIGLTVLPSHLLPVFAKHVGGSYPNAYFSPSLLSQATLEIYIRSKLLKKHTAAIKCELKARLDCLKTHFDQAKEYGAEWIGGESGFYCYLLLPDSVDESQLVEKLRKQGILVTPGSECFIHSRYYKKGIRLSVARTTIDDIRIGIPQLYAEISQMIAKG